jgi:hypothetical protein
MRFEKAHQAAIVEAASQLQYAADLLTPLEQGLEVLGAMDLGEL